MIKPTKLGRLTAKEYRLIAVEAKISQQTVVKWFSNSLAVRPSTEKKIINAWLKIAKESNLGIDKQIHDNSVVIARIEAMNNELEAQKKVIQDRISIIIEL